MPYTYVTLREKPQLMNAAAEWFHEKWGVSTDAYLSCIADYLGGKTEYGWYLCLDGERIVGGMGVIENDFHDRADLSPNVCAVYTEEDCRGKTARLGCVRHEGEGYLPALPRHRPHGILRKIRLGIFLHGSL